MFGGVAQVLDDDAGVDFLLNVDWWGIDNEVLAVEDILTLPYQLWV